MADDDFWETIWTLWKVLLGGFVFISVLVVVWVFYPEQAVNVVIVAIVSVTIFLYAKVSQSRTSSDEIPANYVTSLGGSVGGKVELQSESIVFTPSKMERYLRRKPFNIPYEDIESIKKVSRLEDGLVGIFRRNGLSNRIQIELEDGTQEWFTVSDLESAAEKLSEAIQER